MGTEEALVVAGRAGGSSAFNFGETTWKVFGFDLRWNMMTGSLGL
jgi:hypothetical protein